MSKKGFTLIELLAVIIILGLLSVLIIPKVTESIRGARENVGKASAAGLLKTAENYYMEQKTSMSAFEGCTYNFTSNSNTCTGLEFSGEKPAKGILRISSNGMVAFSVQIDKYCYIKKYSSEDILSQVDSSNLCDTVSIPEIVKTGDGLYEAQGEPNRLIYRGTDPNNYVYLKENGTNVLYRILSYEPDGTIKVIRDSEIIKDGNNKIKWDNDTDRQNTASGYYCNSADGCNVWGNQSNTYYSDKTLSELSQDFYFYYYPDNQSINFSTKYNNNYGSVTTNSSLNNYLNDTWINTLDFKDEIETHSFNVGGVFYYNYFNNGYKGGDKGLLKEKGEEQVYTWNGKIALINITEFVETSLSDTCTSVYSNYYYHPNNLTQTGTSSYTAKHSNGQWPCALKNWNYKSSIHQWFLSAYSYYRNAVWIVSSSGSFYDNGASYASISVRPAFYLKAGTVLSGSGISSDPMEIVEF